MRSSATTTPRNACSNSSTSAPLPVSWSGTRRYQGHPGLPSPPSLLPSPTHVNISYVFPLISYAVVALDQSNQSSSDTLLSAQGFPQGSCAGCGAQQRRAGLGGGGVAVGDGDGGHCCCSISALTAHRDPSMCPGPPLACGITLNPIEINTLMGSRSLSLLLCGVDAHLPLFPLTRRT